MNINAIVIFLLSFLFIQAPNVAMEKNFRVLEKESFLKFHEYPSEYLYYADTLKAISDNIQKSKKPRIMEIGSSSGYFLDKVLDVVDNREQTIGLTAVEFKEDGRKKALGIFDKHKKSPYQHKCILSKTLNITDFIVDNPKKKKNSFSFIASFHTLDRLCPTDLINVLGACHNFLKPNGSLWLTLQCSAAFGKDAPQLQHDLEAAIDEGDLFPGFNMNEELTILRLSYFLLKPLDYPLNSGVVDRRQYIDHYKLAHDFCPKITTVHDAKWTKMLLEDFGFDVEECKVVIDDYPNRPLKVQEGCEVTDIVETEYLFVKASKGKKSPNLERLGAFKSAAKEKEARIYELYQMVLNSINRVEGWMLSSDDIQNID